MPWQSEPQPFEGQSSADLQCLGRTYGPYRIVRIEGSTDFSTLYTGEDQSTGPTKLVLLECPSPRAWQTPRFRPFFLGSAEMALRLRHPNILRALQSIQVEDRPAIVYEYHHGVRLMPLMRRLWSLRMPAPVDVATTIGLRVLDGLGFAHEAGFLHQNVSPDAVYVASTGRVFVAHFGHTAVSFASPRVPSASLPYASPEQFQAKKTVGPRADLYGVALLVLELMIGKQIYGRSSREETMRAILNRERPPVERLLPFRWTAMSEALEIALHPDAGQRFETASALRKALERALAQAGKTDEHRAVERFLDSVLSLTSPTASNEGPVTTPSSGPAVPASLSPVHGRMRGSAPLDGAAFDTSEERSDLPSASREVFMKAEAGIEALEENRQQKRWPRAVGGLFAVFLLLVIAWLLSLL
ncbi:MAG: serine/threonine-protein kinase [Myxococcota bacterium]